MLLFEFQKPQALAAGTPSDSEDTLRFAALTGVRPMVDKFPFETVAEGYARILSDHAQFRVVLTMQKRSVALRASIF